jgi:citrate lyase gamma subunit
MQTIVFVFFLLTVGAFWYKNRLDEQGKDRFVNIVNIITAVLAGVLIVVNLTSLGVEPIMGRPVFTNFFVMVAVFGLNLALNWGQKIGLHTALMAMTLFLFAFEFPFWQPLVIMIIDLVLIGLGGAISDFRDNLPEFLSPLADAYRFLTPGQRFKEAAEALSAGLSEEQVKKFGKKIRKHVVEILAATGRDDVFLKVEDSTVADKVFANLTQQVKDNFKDLGKGRWVRRTIYGLLAVLAVVLLFGGIPIVNNATSSSMPQAQPTDFVPAATIPTIREDGGNQSTTGSEPEVVVPTATLDPFVVDQQNFQTYLNWCVGTLYSPIQDMQEWINAGRPSQPATCVSPIELTAQADAANNAATETAPTVQPTMTPIIPQGTPVPTESSDEGNVGY